MKLIYISIVVLVLYGDLLKRFMPASASLFALYGLATVIPLMIFALVRQNRASITPEGHVVYLCSLTLMCLYPCQLLTSPSPFFLESLSHAMYMCIPLLYLVVILKHCPQFDLARLAKYFCILMIPVNIIGFVQYYADPNFLISTYYSDTGGTILRNYLDEGYFRRFPSLFASADRYSAMALMQFYLAIVSLQKLNRTRQGSKYWIAFNFVSSCIALFIAGARSRILIAGAAITLSAIALLLSLQLLTFIKYLKGLFVLVAALMIVALFCAICNDVWYEESNYLSFPILKMLSQTLEEGDVGDRIGEAVYLSSMNDDITFFGQGLGTIGHGKPGEFGIQSIWIESGWFWGTLMMTAFIGIISAISVLALKSLLTFQALAVALYGIPSLLLVFALLAGLTSAFELSSGVILCCSIAVIVRSGQRVR